MSGLPAPALTHPAQAIMSKQYRPDTILVSPRVAAVMNDEALAYFLDRLDALTAQPSRTLELPHTTARSWGIELADADREDRVYRVLAVIEEEPVPPTTFLTLLTVEENDALETPPRARMSNPKWRISAVPGDTP